MPSIGSKTPSFTRAAKPGVLIVVVTVQQLTAELIYVNQIIYDLMLHPGNVIPLSVRIPEYFPEQN